MYNISHIIFEKEHGNPQRLTKKKILPAFKIIKKKKNNLQHFQNEHTCALVQC